MSTWTSSLRLHVTGLRDVFFCHATPRNDTEIFTRLTAEDPLVPMFEGVDGLAFGGHTHMQFDRTVGRTRVVNAGSVGMSFGEPGAYWLLLGPAFELRRTTYDAERAAARMKHAVSRAEEFAARNVVSPPSEDEMLRV